MLLEKKQIKVLIATGIFPPDVRGPATMLAALPEALHQKGLAVKVLTYSDVEKAASDGDEVIRVLRNKNFLSRYLKYFFAMWRLARRVDLIYVTDIYSVGYFAYLIKKLTGKKYIVRFAGDSAWESAVLKNATNDYIMDFQDKNYGGKIEKIKARRKKILITADKVITVSSFMSQLALKIGVAEKNIKVIYNSVDFINDSWFIQEKVNEIKKQYGHDVKIIVSAGQLNPWKGFDGVIKIMPELIKKIGGVNLLILGQGQEMENLKNLAASLNVTDSTRFLGKINHKDILNYFKAADLFILNSNYEGLSHTILEVIKAGAPIITTYSGGNPEVIENEKSGMLVHYNNEEELLNAAVKILSDQNLAKKFVENAKNDLVKFNWEKLVVETVSLINEII